MASDEERTIWCGNLHEKVTEEILYELFLQAGPVESVRIPKDNDKRQRSYGFITYTNVASIEYALQIFEGTKLFQRQLTLHRRSKNTPIPVAMPNFGQPQIQLTIPQNSVLQGFNNSNSRNLNTNTMLPQYAQNFRDSNHAQSVLQQNILLQLSSQLYSGNMNHGNVQQNLTPKISNNDRLHNHKPYSRNDQTRGNSSNDRDRDHRFNDNRNRNNFRR